MRTAQDPGIISPNKRLQPTALSRRKSAAIHALWLVG
jgi:hypothetical protein